MRQLSPRLQALQEPFERRYMELGTRVYVEPEDAAAVAQSLLRAYRETVGQPAILRRAAALQAFVEDFPVSVRPDELIVGRQTFNPPWAAPDYPAEALAELGYAATTGHIVHDYGTLVRRGVEGLREDCSGATHRAQGTDESGRDRLRHYEAFVRALYAFALFIRRHAEAAEAVSSPLAEDLRHLTAHPPQTFAQALQLVWFAQIFLHAENPSMAISFGRLDQILWPFLQRDLQTGRLTEDEAFEWVGAFCLKCCEGEESQNLTLGGVTADGGDAANPLSVMFLEAIEALQCHQPSLTVRWPGTGSEALKQAACRLAATGGGQPGFMNDAVVTEALQAAGIPPDRAADWAIVGCYEACPQGDCYANTVLGSLHLPMALAEYLDEARTETFADFLAGLLEHVRATYAGELQRLQHVWNHLRDRAPSPFGSVLMGVCVESLTPLEAGGARFSLVGINILGLGTLVDSLHAIRALVYDQHRLSLAELATEMRDNLPDESLRAQLQHLPGRYGTDNPATNRLAAEWSEWLARLVLDSRLEHGVRPYPAFFRFSGDIHDLRVASADGRRREDVISYGAGPSTSVRSNPTAVMRSASHVAHRLCACGNPLAITLPQPPPPPEQGAQVIRDLVDTYFGLGGMHAHFNTPSLADLRDAVERPQHHQDLMIRVSGFSARFVRMDRRWQEALIERAERGM